jgi:IPT/TIG domain
MLPSWQIAAYLLGLVGVLVYFGVGSLAGRGSGGILGAVRGEDGKLSSSKFQFFLWTGIVVYSYIALWVARAHGCWGSGAPSMPELPGNVLLAMGFSVITLATAKGVTTAYVAAGRIAKGRNGPVRLRDLVTQDDGTSPDLSKIQMLTWTVIAAVTYLYAVGAALPTFGTCISTVSFPDIGTALMALMGIGQGAYLGAKIVSSNTVILTSLSPAQALAGGPVTINGSGFGTTPGSVLFGNAAASLAPGSSSWTDTQIIAIAPAIDPSDSKPFQPGDTVYVSVLLTGTNNQSPIGNGLPFTYAAVAAPAIGAAIAGTTPKWVNFSGTARRIGVTTSGRVTVYIDAAFSAAMQNATDLLRNADSIVKANDELFDSRGSSVNVLIWALLGKTDGSAGGDHAACNYSSGGNIEVCVSLGSSQRVSALFEAELSECSMGGNLCSQSTGEALSRWCATWIVGKVLSYFETARKWADDGMPDYVNQTLSTDKEDDSIGCGMAFLSWMMSQGHALSAIAQAMVKLGDGGTLAEMYAKITSDSADNAWPTFQTAVNALPNGVTSDDPFNAKP